MGKLYCLFFICYGQTFLSLHIKFIRTNIKLDKNKKNTRQKGTKYVIFSLADGAERP